MSDGFFEEFYQSNVSVLFRTTEVRFASFFQWIYYYGSNKSTGKKTGKMHLCAVRERRTKIDLETFDTKANNAKLWLSKFT